MKSNSWLSVGKLRAVGAAIAFVSFACGAKVPSTYESNTNWLRFCATDAQCAAGMICACGACSEPCTAQGSQCPGDLVCESETACGAERSACVARCETDADCSYLARDASCRQGACNVEAGVSRAVVGQGRSSTPTTTANAAPSTSYKCSSAGHYERGKGDSVPDCCMGLSQVYFDSAADVDGVRQCVQPPGHVNFACVAGSCGDGVCEVGENVVCGCAADCPDARVDAPSTSGSVPVPQTSASTSAGSAACSPAGHSYFRGKGEAAAACCPGLKEVAHDAESRDASDNVSCQPIPEVLFACIAGSCGDGTCEAGEDHACGCASDCASAAAAQGVKPPVATSCKYLGGDYPVGSTLPNMCADCTCEAGGVIKCGDVRCSQSGSVLPCSEIPNYDPAVNHNPSLEVSVAQVVGQQLIIQYKNLCEASPHDVALCYRDAVWGVESSLVLDFIFDDHTADPCPTPTAGEMRFYLGAMGTALTTARGNQSAAGALKTKYGTYQLPVPEPTSNVSCGPCTVNPAASTWCQGETHATQPVEWVCGGSGSDWQDALPLLNAACTDLATNAPRWCCAPTFSLNCAP